MTTNDDLKPLGWLLLRDGHAVPLLGLAPDAIKASRKRAVEHPESELRHRQGLNAIVSTLGFKGDFGDYTNRGWSEVQTFLADHGCGERRVLFPHESWFGFRFDFTPHSGPNRRQLADRVFRDGQQAPTRVFLGTGVDWEPWDQMAYLALSTLLSSHRKDEDFVPQSRDEAVAFLIEHRFDLMGQWGFLDDKLVHGPVNQVVDKTYWAERQPQAERDLHARQLLALVRTFRYVFDQQREGWVDLLPFNERLTFLRAHDGSWDLIWRDLRTAAPPQAEGRAAAHKLHVEDLPMVLMSDNDVARSLYFRRGAWAEREAHEAEQHFYDQGKTPLDRQMTPGDEVLYRYLSDRGALPGRERVSWDGPPPDGFLGVTVEGRRLLVGALVTLGEFSRMLTETGFLDRRSDKDEDWHRANDGQPDGVPVGATWHDAMAFTAWKERQLGVAMRLPTKGELRAMRPLYSERYAQLSGGDFRWESRPPRPILVPQGNGTEQRVDVPSAVAWSEPRFHEPGPDRPEFPPAGGWSSTSRDRSIADFPPAAPWSATLPWAEHSGLQFIDAWDAYEWCQEREWISGRYWEGGIGAGSWGAYKNIKVGFRLVIDLG